MIRHVAPAAMARNLGRAAFAGGFVLFLWAFPASPFALYRADVMLGTGNPARAVHVYDAVARTNPLPLVRGEALERAAVALYVELGEPTEARARLEERLLMRMSEDDRAALLEKIGEMLIEEAEHAEAARRLREAHDIAPDLREAAGRLDRAAQEYATADDYDRAATLWRRLGQLHPEHLARAELGLANIALAQGDVLAALAAFQRAGDHTFDSDIASVANLGAATCLERLGDLDQALAELDEADLPRDVHDRRAAQIRARGALQ